MLACDVDIYFTKVGQSLLGTSYCMFPSKVQPYNTYENMKRIRIYYKQNVPNKDDQM